MISKLIHTSALMKFRIFSMWSKAVSRLRINALANLLIDGGKRFVRVHGPQHAAATAYYGIFSLFPLTFLLSSVSGIFFEANTQEIAIEILANQLHITDESISAAMKRFLELGPPILIASTPALILTSGTMTASLRKGLDEAFGPTRNRSFLRSRLIDYSLIPFLTLPLVGGFLTTTFWDFSLINYTRLAIADLESYLQTPQMALAVILSFLLTFISTLLWYRFVPTLKPPVQALWFGALIAAAGFEAVKYGFTYYISRSITFDLFYGPLTSIMATMLFIFISAYIFIFGAAVAQQMLVRANKRDY